MENFIIAQGFPSDLDDKESAWMFETQVKSLGWEGHVRNTSFWKCQSFSVMSREAKQKDFSWFGDYLKGHNSNSCRELMATETNKRQNLLIQTWLSTSSFGKFSSQSYSFSNLETGGRMGGRKGCLSTGTLSPEGGLE